MKLTNKQNPYPNNLLLDIDAVNVYGYQIDLDHLSVDQIEGLKYAISTLRPRDQLILACRYEDNMTMREVGERFGVSTGRIGQLVHKCLKLLSNPIRFRYIKDGYSSVLDVDCQVELTGSVFIINQHLRRSIWFCKIKKEFCRK